jgi:uncharacterized repeat protein (TIGR01451 family)
MRRTIVIPVALVLLAVGIVAFVKAQDWSSWSSTSNQSQPTASSEFSAPSAAWDDPVANEPRRIDVDQSTTALPPQVITNRFVESAATSQAQFAAGQPAEPALPPITINRFGVAPAQATETTPSLTTSNNPAALGQSSRRPRSLRELAPVEPETTPADAAEAEPEVPEASPMPAPVTAPVESPRATQNELRSTTTSPATAPASNLLIDAAEPVLSVKASGAPTMLVGKAAVYTIELANGGATEAEDVTVSVDVPQWAEIINSEATSGSARQETLSGDSSRVKWNLFHLEGGASEQLTLKIIPRQSRAFDLQVSVSHTPKLRLAQIEVQEPKLELALSGPRDVLYGETKTFAITVSNPGTGPAENVVVNLLPISSGQESGGVSKIGTIAAGDRKVIEIELTARQVGDLEIRAQAYGDGGLRTEAAERVHVRRADLEAVVAGPPIKYAGTVAAYQVRVANTGDALAENVTTEAILPRSATFVGATDGGAWNEEQGRVVWQIGTMRPGAARTFEVRCMLAEAGANRLEVISSGADDLTAATACITRVEALADLKLLINDPQGPVPTGEATVYEVRIMNRGTKAAEGVQVAAFFSDGVEPIAVEGGSAELGVGQVVFQPIPRIGAGQQVILKISAKADREGTHTFRTEVVCTSPHTELAAQETTQFYEGAASQDNSPLQATPLPASESAEVTLPPRFGDRR